jgi:hypothetical protein
MAPMLTRDRQRLLRLLARRLRPGVTRASLLAYGFSIDLLAIDMAAGVHWTEAVRREADQRRLDAIRAKHRAARLRREDREAQAGRDG